MTEAPKKRGWARMRELDALDAAARDAIIAGLTADLGRAPTTNERLVIEDIAALTVLARRLERRRAYEKAAVIRDQIARTRRASNFREIAPVERPGDFLVTLAPIDGARK